MTMRRTGAACVTSWSACWRRARPRVPRTGRSSANVAAPAHRRDRPEVDVPAIRTADSLLIMACAALGLLMITRAGSLLRRDGPAQERPVRISAELHPARDSCRFSGCWPATAWHSGPTCPLGLCGGWQWFGLQGRRTRAKPELAPRVPHQLFMIFQMMVAVFTGGSFRARSPSG